jgi:hypothetical protein
MVKAINTATDWHMYDNMRSMTTLSDGTVRLLANTSGAESGPFGGATSVFPTATGFGAGGGISGVNQSGGNYIYIAIRRGPMRTPTLGTSVFSPIISSTYDAVNTTGFPVDAQIWAMRGGVARNSLVVDRLRGVGTGSPTDDGLFLSTALSDADVGTGNNTSRSWNNTGFRTPGYGGSVPEVFWSFRRAPGFFDVVCYTGAGFNTPINHSLGVIPELVIIKTRSNSASWTVAIADPSWASFNTQLSGTLNSTAALVKNTSILNTVTTTSALLTQGGSDAVTGRTYVMYLFASCAGVSKVGKYTGNGSSQTVNCAFAAGARFVMIKRIDSTGDWYVWDTARGIVAGSDPRLSLNTTVAEVTTDDTIDPNSSGFVVNQVAATNVNVSAATYIYLAIA